MTLADTEKQKLVAKATQAVKDKDWPKILRLIDDEGLEPDTATGNKRLSFAHLAAKQGRVDVLKDLHNRGAQLEGKYDKQGMDVVHYAAESGHVDTMDWLATQQVDLDALTHIRPEMRKVWPGGAGRVTEPQHQTPLMLAVMENDPQMVHHLLKHGVDPEVPNKNGDTALMKVPDGGAGGANPIISLLAAYGADLNALDNSDNPAIMRIGAIGFNMQAAEKMADEGAVINPPQARLPFNIYARTYGRGGMFALASEFIEGRENIVAIDPSQPFSKAELFAPNKQGYAPLDSRETWQNFTAIAQALQAQGDPLSKQDLMAENAHGETWLQRAVSCGGYHAVSQILREQGEPIKGSDFADADNPQLPNALGKTAQNSYLGLRVFTDPEHWQGRTAQELKRFRAELPADLREQFSNSIRLATRLQQNERDAGNKGISR